jgi:hypothetical protein
MAVLRKKFNSNIFNISQADPKIEILLLNPDTYCGPVAVINTLLAKYQDIKNFFRYGANESAINKLVTRLSKLMKTQGANSQEPGTKAMDLINGIIQFSAEENLNLLELNHRGWFAGEIENPNNLTNTEWIKKKLCSGFDIVLQVGWYKRSDLAKFIRTGGHYVTLVGYDQQKLYINDPSKRSKRQTKEATVLTHFNSQLINKNLRQGFSNCLELKGLDINSNYGSDTAIIDGAIAYKVQKSKFKVNWS